MRRALLFADRVGRESCEEVFVGFIEGSPFVKGGNPRLSRTHRQPWRIYSPRGIHPSINSAESQGRYYILEE